MLITSISFGSAPDFSFVYTQDLKAEFVDLVPCLFAEIERVSDGFISSSGQQTGDRQPRVRGTFEGWVLLQTGC